jgi:hypothetical protein
MYMSYILDFLVKEDTKGYYVLLHYVHSNIITIKRNNRHFFYEKCFYWPTLILVTKSDTEKSYYIYIYIYIRLKIKPNSVRIRF